MISGRLLRISTLTLILLGALVLVIGCGDSSPEATTNDSQVASSAVSSMNTESESVSTSSEPDRETIIARAVSQVQAALGLPDGSVITSKDTVLFPDAEVMLACDGGGEAALDLDTGRVVYLISGPHDSDSGARLSTEELDAKATQLAEIMGWDSEALAAEGFTVEEAKLIDHGDAPAEYTKRWRGHDEQGVPTNGMIDAAVDASTGTVLHFFYHPGPRASFTQQATITREEAAVIARTYVDDEGWSGTTDAEGLAPPSATLSHTDAPGITGGRELLVWVVTIEGLTDRGTATATVYLDATTGEVLTWTTAG